MPPFMLAFLIQLSAVSKSIAPTDGQVNWLNVLGVMLGIIVSVTVIVSGIKTAVRKMMSEIADAKDDALVTKCIDPLIRDLYEIKGELRSLTR